MELLILLLLSLSGCQAVPLEGEAADCDDPEVFQAVDLALQAHNGDQKHGNLFALSVILEANRTAGPGKNFFVKYRLRETACAVDRSVSWKNCEFLETSEGDTGECEAEIHFDDTINFSNIEQRCKITPAPGKVTQSFSGCLGCWHNMDTQSTELVPIVKYTVGQFNNQSEKQSLFDIREITKAQRQVVAGWNYKFEYSIKETNCSKDKFSDLTPECKLIPAGGEGTCTVEAYVDIRNTLVRADQNCKLAVVEHSICAGCPTSIATDSEILKEPLDAALEKYNSESSNDFYYKVVSVTKATSQVVAGIMYRIEFNIKKTDCSKADFPKLSDGCSAIEESVPLTCTASVYMKAWKHEVAAKVTCEPPNRTILLRRPPGFTPFRKANMNLKRPSTESEHRTGDELNLALGELQEDVKEQEDDIATISPNKDLLLDLPSSPDSSQSLLSLFDTVPDLPEPKCPGKPWKPIVTPAVPIDEPGDFDLKDLLPLPGEESTVGPHETVPLVTEKTSEDADLAGGLSFGDFDLAHALS
uniref:Kininogen-1 isoform X1 n=1 Tax=Pogona vitticeps TaxID=103695 RepID=A0ABM5G3X8_9SAUR